MEKNDLGFILGILGRIHSGCAIHGISFQYGFQDNYRMNRLEQSLVYLRQYLAARRATPWIVHASMTDRAVDSLQDLDGIAGDWNTRRPYGYYYYPQSTTE